MLSFMTPVDTAFDCIDNLPERSSIHDCALAARPFLFLWQNQKGDCSLRAEPNWQQPWAVGNAPALMLRGSSAADAVFCAANLAPGGQVVLHYRSEPGAAVASIKSPCLDAAVMLLEKHGKQCSLSLISADNIIHPVATVACEFPDNFCIGVVNQSNETPVCLQHLRLRSGGEPQENARRAESSLETIDIISGLRTLHFRTLDFIEAPNRLRDGTTFLFNSRGKLFSLSLNDTTPEPIPSAFAERLNNDHGPSPDESCIAISHHDDDGTSHIYLLPRHGGEPQKITKAGPSYWHGWSPDGQCITYCGERRGSFDIYRLDINGGEEIQMTQDAGHNDGPEYSPCGQWIYFNSDRSGCMKIWRMPAAGGEAEVITKDDYADWFPHPSPDGHWLAFLSYDKDVEGHPPNRNVCLRLMDLHSGEIRVLAHLFGGQGSINVPSWSADSRQLAFVSYALVGDKD